VELRSLIPKDCKIDNQFIEIIKQMMLVNPKERLTLNEILDKPIIKQRIKCYLKENSFNYSKARKTIEKYDKEYKKEEKFPIIIENDGEEEKESKKK